MKLKNKILKFLIAILSGALFILYNFKSSFKEISSPNEDDKDSTEDIKDDMPLKIDSSGDFYKKNITECFILQEEKSNEKSILPIVEPIKSNITKSIKPRIIKINSTKSIKNKVLPNVIKPKRIFTKSEQRVLNSLVAKEILKTVSQDKIKIIYKDKEKIQKAKNKRLYIKRFIMENKKQENKDDFSYLNPKKQRSKSYASRFFNIISKKNNKRLEKIDKYDIPLKLKSPFVPKKQKDNQNTDPVSKPKIEKVENEKAPIKLKAPEVLKPVKNEPKIEPQRKIETQKSVDIAPTKPIDNTKTEPKKQIESNELVNIASSETKNIVKEIHPNQEIKIKEKAPKVEKSLPKVIKQNEEKEIDVKKEISTQTEPIEETSQEAPKSTGEKETRKVLENEEEKEEEGETPIDTKSDITLVPKEEKKAPFPLPKPQQNLSKSSSLEDLRLLNEKQKEEFFREIPITKIDNFKDNSFVYEGFCYKVNNKENRSLSLISFDSDDPLNVISINGPNFKKNMGNSLFLINDEIYSVNIFEKYVFSGLKIYEINLPETLEVIEDECFRETRLSRVKIPEGIKKLGKRCFSNCPYLEKISLPSTLETIGDFCFSECINLYYLRTYEGVKNMGIDVFRNSKPEDVKIKTLKEKGEQAELYANDVVKVNWLKNLEFNYDGIYYRVLDKDKKTLIIIDFHPGEQRKVEKALEALKTEEFLINDEIFVPEEIKSDTFRHYTIEKIELPKTVKHLRAFCVSDCEDLEEIILNEGLETIGDGCFNRCRSLMEITIPKSVKNIGYGIFNNCCNLQKVLIPKELNFSENHNFGDCFQYDLEIIRY